MKHTQWSFATRRGLHGRRGFFRKNRGQFLAQSVTDLRTGNTGRRGKIRVYCRERVAIIPTCGRADYAENIRTSASPPVRELQPRYVVRGISQTIPERISPAERPQIDTETEEPSGEAAAGRLRERALRCIGENSRSSRTHARR